MISVMALEHRNYIRQTTVSRGNAVVQKSVHHFLGYFHLTSSHRHYQMLATNVGSVCFNGKPHNTRFPAHQKLAAVSISHRNKLLCLLQAGRIHVVICNALWSEVWMPDIFPECPGMYWCNSNCFCSLISIQVRNFDTIYHTFNLVSKFDGINQKAAPTH